MPRQQTAAESETTAEANGHPDEPGGAPEPAKAGLDKLLGDMLQDRIKARESEAKASDALKAAGYTTGKHCQFAMDGRHFMAGQKRTVVEARIGRPGE